MSNAINDILKSYFETRQGTRHKVFLSYYHDNDQFYKNEFERLFGHLFINKSVGKGEIDSDLSDEYIKRLIQKGYITDTSVFIVLVGPKTYCRKHVDWEISAAISQKVGGYSGILGILLPTFSIYPNDVYYYKDLPPRLADNVKTGYANIYTWNWITTYEARIKDAVEEAFNSRIRESDKIDNYTTPQFIINRCS